MRLRTALFAAAAVSFAACTRHVPPAEIAAPLLPKAAMVAVEDAGFALLSLERPTSFHLGYTQLFRAHQPMYLTADAVLHAWHSSYDAILATIEEQALVPALAGMLDAMSARARDPDVVRYLAVARSLLRGDDASDEAVKLAVAAAGPGTITIFGAPQNVELSMFKPRGHYTKTPLLQQYFRAVSWLGRIEVRFMEPGPDGKLHLQPRAYAALRALRATMTGKEDATWFAIDATLANLVGPPDSLSLPGWDASAKALGDSPSDDALRAAFPTSSVQRIRNQLRGPVGSPAAFVFLGPRYVFDSHVFTSVTYGDLRTKRMMPTPLDIGATVFDNPAAKKALAPEIATYGVEYEHALDAVSLERKKAGDTLWRGSVYHLWLDALRELSPNAERDRGMPSPFLGEAWDNRILNTQLGAWAELRHDNILYAKQSFTAMALCEYPDAYVEPYPRFWGTLADMAVKTRAAWLTSPVAVPEASRKAIDAYITRFIDVTGRLRQIAERERRNEPLTSDDLDFLNHMVKVNIRAAGCTSVTEPEGWFADLYFDRADVLELKPIIADVHTEPTDEDGNVVGKVLHVGTAYPRGLVVKIAHDGGKHTQTYRGMTTAYAELVTSHFERLDDETWRARVERGRPPPPSWLAGVVIER